MTRMERIAASLVSVGLSTDALSVAKVLSYTWEQFFGSVEIQRLGDAETEYLGHLLRLCSSTLYSAVTGYEQEVGDPEWNRDSWHAQTVRTTREADELFDKARAKIEALPEDRRKQNLDVLYATAEMEDADAIPAIRKLMDSFGG